MRACRPSYTFETGSFANIRKYMADIFLSMRLMLRHLLLLLLVPLALLPGIKASATHFYGADLNYTWDSGNRYIVTLTVFGDCSGSAFSTLNGATAQIRTYNGATLYNTMNISQVGNGFEVTPVCPSQASNTVCSNPSSTIPGVTRYIYQGKVTLNALSANWKFQFTGTMSTSTAGRSNSITNIVGGSTTVLEALLNNTVGTNSSVNYTTIPTPFFCVNKPANYNPGAVDPNLDSLSFSLVTGLNAPGTVTYVTPFTATAPLATSAGSYSFSASSGQISFTPNAGQRALIVSQVNEYRNGVLVGTSMREMTFVVLTTCSNNPPTGTVSNISSGLTALSGTAVAACASSGIISFKINPTDADGDHINMQVTGLPAGATFSITGNNSLAPSGTFTWNIANVPAGTYNFFITFTDDGCSLSSKQSVAYSVTVYGNPNPGFNLINPATCTKKATFSLTPFLGSGPYQVSVTGPGVADTFKNVSGTIQDSVIAGTYTISTLSSIGCTYDTIITFVPPSNLVLTALSSSPTCVGGSNGSLTATASNGFPPYTYAIGSGSFSSANTFSGLTSGTYLIHAKDAGGCTKDSSFTLKDTAAIYSTVTQTKPPCNHFSNGAVTIAAYNSVGPYTYAIGSGSYQASGIFNGLSSGTYTVHIMNSLGCVKDTLIVLADSVHIAASLPITNPLCFGGTNGVVNVNASGAYPPYVYAIGSGSFGPSNTFSGLSAGTYTIHVKDIDLCYFDTTIVITEPAVVTISANVSANATCNGGNNGALTVTAGGGTAPYQYNINAGPYVGSNSFSSLPAGTYTLGVKDAHGCIKTTTATITEPTPIVIGYTFVSPNCSYSADGSLTLSASGGTPGYTYSVDGAAYTASGTFTGLLGGAHVLHAKDAANCIKDSNIILIAPARIAPHVAIRSSTCATLGDGTVTLSANGGTPGYTYAKGSGSYGASGFFNLLPSGTYTFHVKDAHGCIGDTTVTIIDSLNLHGNVILSNVVCYNQNNGSITVTGIGGQSPYRYALGAGPYTPVNVFNLLPNASYMVYIQDTNGCIKDTALTITQPNLLVPSANVTNVLCNGQTNGQVIIGAAGGSPGYLYAQGAGAYTATGTFGGLGAGTYTFHVKDTHSCISDTTVTITQPSPITIGVVVSNVLCHGGNSGTVTITAGGGTPAYTYAIDGGGFGASNLITSLLAGTHTVHIKDAAGCIKDSVITITEPAALQINYTLTRPLCNGDANGSISFSALGGTSPYIYALNSSSYTATTLYSSLSAGTYGLHIKDAKNCRLDSNVQLTEPAPLGVSIAVNNVLCNGDTSGSVSVTASGGTIAYSYAIDAGAFGAVTTFTGLGAGSHTVHIKDANNCLKDTTFTISQPNKLKISYSSTDPLCNGDANGTITIIGIGGTLPYQYALGAGAFVSTPGFNGLTASVYVLHVKDAHLCTRDSIITMSQPSKVTVTAAVTNVLCNGGNTGTVTITASGGITPYTYAYDAGSYGASNLLTGLTAGVHIIHTKDANACLKDTTITITEPTALSIGYTSVSPLCNGDANGSISITAAGGSGSYLYSLNASAFSTTTAYPGLSAGIFVLHVKDGNNCHKDSTITLTQPAALAFTVNQVNVLCNGDTSGSVTINAAGGTPSYTYAIDAGSFGSTTTFTGLGAGNHTVHLKDANNCTKDSIITITQPLLLKLTYTFVQPLCNGAANGSITITGVGGKSPYQYAMGAGTYVATGLFNGLTAGNYTLHVKDANGCVKDSNIILGQPSPLSYSLVLTNVLCNGGNSGTVTVTGSGGIPPYTYAVDAGVYTPSFLLTGLNAGAHIVHMKDVNGCIKDSTITITEPPVLGVTVSVVNPACNGASTGSITVSGIGGTLPYQYALNASPFTTTTVYASLNAGAFVVHLKDSKGCTKDTNITLTQPPALAFSLGISNVLCNGDTSGKVTVTASGGVSPLTYAANSRLFTGSNVLTGFGAGVDTIHLKDNNGCLKDTIITITQPLKLALTYTFVRPLCNGDTNGSITISASGGTLPYTYAIGLGAFQSSGAFINLGAGSYTLHVKDGNGCTRDSLILFTQPQKLGFSLAITNVLCNGGSTGTVTVTASGGTTAYQYASDGNAFGPSNLLTGFAAGTHFVHLKDANGCTKDTSIIITEPAILNLSFTSVMPSCNAGANGTATITGIGGTTPYSYAVDAGAFQPSATLTGLAAGPHTLHIKDANGCFKDSVFTLLEPTAISATAAVKRARCTPLVNGYVWLTASGGTPGYTYAYNTNPYQASNQFNNLASGIYTFHIKDTKGCIYDTTIAVFDSVFVHANYTVTNVSCFAGTNGSVSVVPSGGDLPYSYSLNASAYSTTNPITNLAASAYILHVKDNNGCILDTPLTITQPSLIVPGVAITQPLCFGGSTGFLVLNASGGTPGYTYANGSGAYSGSAIINSLAAGTYTVHIKDANACIHDTTVTIGQPTKLLIDSIITTDVKCYGDNSGTATVYARNGTSPYTYAFDANPYAASNILVGFIAGTHVVHVKDNNGCIHDSAIRINQPAPLHFMIPGITQPTCEGFTDGSITIAATGGYGPYSYQMPPQPFKYVNIFGGLGEGTYTIRVKDSNGCQYDTTIILNGNPHIVIDGASLISPNCFGFNNGSVQLNVSGGVIPLTYHLSNPSQTNGTGLFDSLKKGSYQINVTDSKGCTKDTSVTLVEPPLLAIVSSATPNDCEGADDGGSVSTLVEGGTSPYSYTWNTGQTTSQLNHIANGAYWVTVTDGNGCQDSSLAIVNYDNCCKPFIPDAFTPNKDGRNDIYRIRWKGDISKLQFSIYNRFGERVFVSYQADVGWDGTYHGKPCDMGVYFFNVKFICGSKGDNQVEYKGDVTLIR